MGDRFRPNTDTGEGIGKTSLVSTLHRLGYAEMIYPGDMSYIFFSDGKTFCSPAKKSFEGIFNGDIENAIERGSKISNPGINWGLVNRVFNCEMTVDSVAILSDIYTKGNIKVERLSKKDLEKFSVGFGFREENPDRWDDDDMRDALGRMQDTGVRVYSALKPYSMTGDLFEELARQINDNIFVRKI
jgi:hypothetical protein